MANKTVLTPSTIKTVDASVLDYYKNLNLFVGTNQGFSSVPVFWEGAETAYQMKDVTLRDKHGMLILPQVIVSRESVSKSLDWKGTYWSILPSVSDVKGGVVTWSKRIKKDKTSEFARANSVYKTGKINFKTQKNEEIVYEHIMMPIPVYMDISYKIVIRTEYQQQMNQILQLLSTKEGNSKFVPLERDGWKYEAFYDEDYGFKTNSGNVVTEERMFKSEMKLRVLGYVIGGDENEDQPIKVRRENAVRIGISESIYTGSLP